MASGYSLFFEDVSCVIKDKRTNQVIVEVQMAANKLFPLEVFCVKSHALVVKETNESKL